MVNAEKCTQTAGLIAAFENFNAKLLVQSQLYWYWLKEKNQKKDF